MFRHLDRLHARAEPHGCVGLGETPHHSSRNARDEVAGAERFGVIFGLGRDEQQHGTLGAGLNPRPGDQALVDCYKCNVLAQLFYLSPFFSQENGCQS